MAKRKKSTHRRHHRRSVGAVHTGSGFIPLLLGVAGGVVASKFIHKAGANAGIKGSMLAIGEIGLGFLVTKNAKTPIMQGIGIGIMTTGVGEGISSVPLLSRIGDDMGADYAYLQPNVGEIKQLISGVGDDMAGDDMAGNYLHNMVGDDNSDTHYETQEKAYVPLGADY